MFPSSKKPPDPGFALEVKRKEARVHQLEQAVAAQAQLHRHFDLLQPLIGETWDLVLALHAIKPQTPDVRSLQARIDHLHRGLIKANARQQGPALKAFPAGFFKSRPGLFARQKALPVAMEFDQVDVFNTGVCAVLTRMALELRARGFNSATILAVLAEPQHRDAIRALQGGGFDQPGPKTYHWQGRNLYEHRRFRITHAYCQGIWPVAAGCPSLQATGEFPQGLQYYLDGGRRSFAIRLPDGGAQFVRSLPAPPAALRDPDAFQHSLANLNYRPSEPVIGALMRYRKNAFEALPIFFLLMVAKCNGWADPEEYGHAVMLDMSPGHRGIFDPNLGWIPAGSDDDGRMEEILHRFMHRYPEMGGLIAYQYVPTRRACGCADKKKPH